jgi:hypothetical protein
MLEPEVGLQVKALGSSFCALILQWSLFLYVAFSFPPGITAEHPTS